LGKALIKDANLVENEARSLTSQNLSYDLHAISARHEFHASQYFSACNQYQEFFRP